MPKSILLKETKVGIGDTVKVYYTFLEKSKKKSQIFEGIVLGIRNSGENKMITVRKNTRSNIGVERIFPVNSPHIEKVEVTKKGTVRRAKINFIRDISHKDIKEKIYR